MFNLLKKISSILYIPAKEFNTARFRYEDDRTETVYAVKGFLFGIPIRLTISEKSMKSIIDFYNNKKMQDEHTETYYNF